MKQEAPAEQVDAEKVSSAPPRKPVSLLAETFANIVQLGMPSVITLNPPIFGKLEEIVTEAHRLHLRIAGVPDKCMTIFPPICVDEETLFAMCNFYCFAEAPTAQADAIREIYLAWYMAREGLEPDRSALSVERIKSTNESASRTKMDAEYQFLLHIAFRSSTWSRMSIVEFQEQCVTAPLLHLSDVLRVVERLRSAIAFDREVTHDTRREGKALSLPPMAASARLLQESARKKMLVPPPPKTTLSQISDDPADTIPTGSEVVDSHASQKRDELENGSGNNMMAEATSAPAVFLQEKDFEIVAQEGVFFDDDDFNNDNGPNSSGGGMRQRTHGGILKIAAIFIKNAIPVSVCAKATEALQRAANTNNLRGKTNGGPPPETGVVGFYDYLNNATERKCRETQYTRENWPSFAKNAEPLLKCLNNAYESAAPHHYKLQKSAIPQHFQLFGTVFSTMTVNHNFRTAMHTDKGDFKNGLGCVAVIDGRFSGCHLALPKLGKAFKLGVGDILLFDTSLQHGNTEVHAPPGMWDRTSIVAYLRTGLFSQTCELEQRKRISATPYSRYLLETVNGASTKGGIKIVDINGAVPGLPAIWVPSPLVKTLSPVQESALAFAMHRLSHDTGCILAMSMGLGKTIVALTITFSCLHEDPSRDVLILTPKTIIPHWIAEASKWKSAVGLSFNAFVPITSDNISEEILRFNQQAAGSTKKIGHVFVVNPESLKSFLRRCPSFAPHIVIVDEGHSVSSKDSKFRSTLISLLTTNKRIILSGTPLQNHVEELFYLVEWISKDAFLLLSREYFIKYSASIQQYVDGDDASRVAASEALEFLLDWSKAFVFRVLDDSLPALHDFLVICGASKSQKYFRKKHMLDKETFALRACEHRPAILSCHPLALILFTHQLSSELSGSPRGNAAPSHATPASPLAAALRHAYYGEIAEDGLEPEDPSVAPGTETPNKPTDDLEDGDGALHEDEEMYAAQMEALIVPEFQPVKADTRALTTLEILRKIPSGTMRFVQESGKLLATVAICVNAVRLREKVIIFSQYVVVQDLVYRALAASGVTCVRVRGRDDLRSRASTISSFCQPKSTSTVIILSARIGSLGIELTAANHVILFDSWWNPQMEAQAIARAHRRSQTKPVTVYRLISKDDDICMLAAQQRKTALFNSVVDGVSTQIVALNAAHPELSDCSALDEDKDRRDNVWMLLLGMPLGETLSPHFDIDGVSGVVTAPEQCVRGILPYKNLVKKGPAGISTAKRVVVQSNVNTASSDGTSDDKTVASPPKPSTPRAKIPSCHDVSYQSPSRIEALTTYKMDEQSPGVWVICGLSAAQRKFRARFNCYPPVGTRRRIELTSCHPSAMPLHSISMRDRKDKFSIDVPEEELSYMDQMEDLLIACGRSSKEQSEDSLQAYLTGIPSGTMRFVQESGKLLATVAICVNAVRLREKVVIFSEYYTVREIVFQVLRACGINCFHIRSRDDVQRRVETIAAFTASHLSAVLVQASVKSGQDQIVLPHADHVIVFDSCASEALWKSCDNSSSPSPAGLEKVCVGLTNATSGQQAISDTIPAGKLAKVYRLVCLEEEICLTASNASKSIFHRLAISDTDSRLLVLSKAHTGEVAVEITLPRNPSASGNSCVDETSVEGGEISELWLVLSDATLCGSVVPPVDGDGAPSQEPPGQCAVHAVLPFGCLLDVPAASAGRRTQKKRERSEDVVVKVE